MATIKFKVKELDTNTINNIAVQWIKDKAPVDDIHTILLWMRTSNCSCLAVEDGKGDVYALFDIGFKVRNISCWLLIFIILLMVFLKYRVPYFLARCCREVLAGFLLIAVILIIFIAADFDRAFTVFHLLFFTNDLWILDPATDLLVNIVPFNFFIDIAVFIGSLMTFFSLAVITAATVFMRKISIFERYPGAAGK